MTINFSIHELFSNSQTISKHRDITVFHGSQKWFQEFDFKKLGLYTSHDFLSNLGFHFTENKIVAEEFSKDRLSSKNYGQILTVHLHLDKTLKLTEHQLVLGIVKFGMEEGYDFGKGIKVSYNKLSKMKYYDEEKIGHQETLYDILRYVFSSPKKLVNDFKKNVLLNNGYDSIEYLNQIEKIGGKKRYDFIALIPDVIEVDLNRIERF